MRLINTFSLNTSAMMLLVVLTTAVCASRPYVIDAFAAKKDITCLDQVTGDMKLQLVKDSLAKVKGLFPKCRDYDEDLTKCSKKDTAFAHMDLALDTLAGLKIGTGDDKECPKCPDPRFEGGPVDCSEVLDQGHRESGVYMIYPRSRVNGTLAVRVYCDMETDGGGWTVIQRRGNYSTQTDFYQGWEAYKNGFGDVLKDFWLGNDYIHTITNQGVYSLRVDMRRVSGEYKYSFHDNFWIGNEKSAYEFHVEGFSGNVSNDLQTQDKTKFSTKDRQNDRRKKDEACADIMHGAWWYPLSGVCGHANLNGLYMPEIDNRNSNWWWNWTGYRGLHFVEMKIRHRSPK